MVTDEERDYMYREYAADPRMRINLGIRRRLAPLVENSRRRIELLNCLLLSMPGTPVIYYGDEIGMGDNVYLGDRNGVRTPMQWTPRPQRRLLARRRRRALLCRSSWTRSTATRPSTSRRSTAPRPRCSTGCGGIIALRKRYPAFGRGTLEFLHPRTASVLAYLREHEGETILCVANLSRFSQSSSSTCRATRAGRRSRCIGRVRFPPIGELPYLLTFGPHGFYWFELTDGADGAE